MPLKTDPQDANKNVLDKHNSNNPGVSSFCKKDEHEKKCQSEIDQYSKRSRKLFQKIFCGCLVPSRKCTILNTTEALSSNVQLLPTTVVQSTKPCNISENSSADILYSTTDSENYLSPKFKANLPSCALLTDALLARAKENDKKQETVVVSKNKTRLSKWGTLKFSRKFIYSEEKIENRGGSVGDTGERDFVNDSLVFSPLPSQIVQVGTHLRKEHVPLLSPQGEKDKGKKCFVVDLDETLVHSSFKAVDRAHFKVNVEIDGVVHRVFVLKRPYIDVFLSSMAKLYECVLFTASLAKYAHPVVDFIDTCDAFRFRLFRDSCTYHRGNYVKNLSQLGRPLDQVVILDNSPASYMFHANNAVQISSWFDDANDRVLLDLIPYFEKLANHPNVVDFLKHNSPPTQHAAVGTKGLSMSLSMFYSTPHDYHMPLDGTDVKVNGLNSVISSVKPLTITSPPNRGDHDVIIASVGQMNSPDNMTLIPTSSSKDGLLVPGRSGPNTKKNIPQRLISNSPWSVVSSTPLLTITPRTRCSTDTSPIAPTSSTFIHSRLDMPSQTIRSGHIRPSGYAASMGHLPYGASTGDQMDSHAPLTIPRTKYLRQTGATRTGASRYLAVGLPPNDDSSLRDKTTPTVGAQSSICTFPK